MIETKSCPVNKPANKVVTPIIGAALKLMKTTYAPISPPLKNIQYVWLNDEFIGIEIGILNIAIIITKVVKETNVDMPAAKRGAPRILPKLALIEA